jgi:hypothetical protein
MVQEYADLDRGLGDDCVRVVTIVRADDGSVGLRFRRPPNCFAGPFEIVEVKTGSAAERVKQVNPGDRLYAVDGRNVVDLDDAAVAALLRGKPSTPLTLSLCSSKSFALSDSEVESALAWARGKGLSAQHVGTFKVLLQLLQPVSLSPMQVPCKLHTILTPCTLCIG